MASGDEILAAIAVEGFALEEAARREDVALDRGARVIAEARVAELDQRPQDLRLDARRRGVLDARHAHDVGDPRDARDEPCDLQIAEPREQHEPSTPAAIFHDPGSRAACLRAATSDRSRSMSARVGSIFVRRNSSNSSGDRIR